MCCFYPPSQKNTAKPPFVLQGAPAEAVIGLNLVRQEKGFRWGFRVICACCTTRIASWAARGSSALGPQGKRAKSVTSKRARVTSEGRLDHLQPHIKLRAYFGHLVNDIASGLQRNNGD